VLVAGVWVSVLPVSARLPQIANKDQIFTSLFSVSELGSGTVVKILSKPSDCRQNSSATKRQKEEKGSVSVGNEGYAT